MSTRIAAWNPAKTACRDSDRQGVLLITGFIAEKPASGKNDFSPADRALKGALVFAAVDQQVLAGDEAGLDAAEKGAVLAQLGRIA